MILSIDRYLEALLAFVPQKRGRRLSPDYLSLIHVPAQGAERVYSLVMDQSRPVLTVASYDETVWEMVDRAGEGEIEGEPDLNALQVFVSPDHPVFHFLDAVAFHGCENLGDGQPGMDYYLMLWQKEGEAGVVECWEPYLRQHGPWMQVIGAVQALAAQFEYAASRN